MSGKLGSYPKSIEPCRPGAGRTIFDGPGQVIEGIDPSQIKLLSDRCLIQDLPQDDERRGLIYIPDSAKQDGVGKQGLLRIGKVIAVGAGDRFLEHGLDAQGVLRRTLITAPCLHDGYGLPDAPPCSMCDEDGRIPVTVPAQCSPGDTVLYDRRRECEIYINGLRYCIVHAEQSVLAVLDSEEIGGQVDGK